jgi:hypothetical protein
MGLIMMKPNFSRKMLVLSGIVVSILVVAAAGAAYFFYRKPQSEISGLLANTEVLPSSGTVDNISGIVEQVSKLILLPKDEQPTIATVTDLEKLKSQPFFAPAQIGDKVLIYTEAKKAYLYRPSSNQLIDVGPVLADDQSAQTATASSVLKEEPVKIPLTNIAIYNGTKTPGLAAKTQKDIEQLNSDFKVISKDNAANDYEESSIIVLNLEFQASADELAKQLNMEIKDLPKGEKKPDKADILIIAGPERADQPDK